MERNTIAEMRQIIEAIEQGKPIQWYNAKNDKWDDTTNKRPNFTDSTYRIKPEEPKKRWRPFKDTAELLAHNKGRNIWLKDITKNKADCWTRLVTLYSESTIAFDTDSEFTMDGLFDNFTFADGRPCGVEEE